MTTISIKGGRKYLLYWYLIIAVVGKLVQIYVLPAKYFYDNWRILSMSTGNGFMMEWGGSYVIMADLFRKINIFGFTTLTEWEIFLGIIGNIIIIPILIKYTKQTSTQFVFALMSIGLLNIYIFNIGKDIAQFSFFFLIYLIISNKYLSMTFKIILSAGVFYWESTFFRPYYIIMACFVVVMYFLFTKLSNAKGKIKSKHIILFVVIVYLTMLIFLLVARLVMPSEYIQLLNAKVESTELAQNSVIKDWIDFGDNIFLYMLNYIINSVRMLIPVELLSGGVAYLPFVAFQVLITYFMIVNLRNIKHLSKQQILVVSVYFAYFVGSVLFEPDFGSFARHEAASFPVMIMLAFPNEHKENKKQSKSSSMVEYNI